MAFAQRAHLFAELALRGIEGRCVVIADDQNLRIAAEHGFDTLRRPNDRIGAKFNDGIEHALTQGADIVATIGSDDWVHPAMFDRLPNINPGPPPVPDGKAVAWSDDDIEVVTGRDIALVDLAGVRARVCESRSRYGVIPWLIPADAFRQAGTTRPIPEAQPRGIDGALVAGLAGASLRWVFHDPHPFTRVDFKSSVNLNSYDAIDAAIGVGDRIRDPWAKLEQHYPAFLVDQARELSATLKVKAAA